MPEEKTDAAEATQETAAQEPAKKPKADRYASLTDSVQTFRAIGVLEAVNGEVVLRGREGERDHIIQLEKAPEKYEHTMEMVKRYMMYGVRGWDTLADIADDLKHKIFEAARQRTAENRPVPDSVKALMGKSAD